MSGAGVSRTRQARASGRVAVAAQQQFVQSNPCGADRIDPLQEHIAELVQAGNRQKATFAKSRMPRPRPSQGRPAVDFTPVSPYSSYW
jgi:hypothetical protein